MKAIHIMIRSCVVGLIFYNCCTKRVEKGQFDMRGGGAGVKGGRLMPLQTCAGGGDVPPGLDQLLTWLFSADHKNRADTAFTPLS